MEALPLLLILLVAAGLRLWHLGHWSLWYDEVVTMQLARAGGVGAMVERLGRIDATRAPLHPLVLMGWIRVFGTSDLAARALSAVLGIATVGAVYGTARSAFGETTARWGAWLCAVCPTLVYFSQEVRMYALLVLLTVLSWWVFLGFRREASRVRMSVYGLLLAVMAYTQPLGLFMLAAHVAAYGLVRRGLKLSIGRWLLVLVFVALLIAPWIGRYFDHAPDYPLPRYPIKYVLAVPIEYIGGTSLTLIPLAVLIAHGLFMWREGRIVVREPVEAVTLLCWFTVPIGAMYLYSHVGHRIFGPSRYNLFVAPAYLVLVARGLAALPSPARIGAGVLMLGFTVQNLVGVTYTPGVKADWRGVAQWVVSRGEREVTVVVVPHDPLFPRTQFEAARYYLEPAIAVALDLGAGQVPAGDRSQSVFRVHCFVGDAWRPDDGDTIVARFYGLTVTRAAPRRGA
jgi:4-amino-4-deoxy-L-arabinose transferase-like glycosyltransferase